MATNQTETSTYSGSIEPYYGYVVIGVYPCPCSACRASFGDLTSPVRFSATLMSADGIEYAEIEHARPESVGLQEVHF